MRTLLSGGAGRVPVRLVPALLAFLLLACATVGRNFDATDASWVKEDVTTKDQVLERMGPPWRVGIDAGDLTWTYGYYEYRAFGDSNSKDLAIHFHPDGKMKSFTLATSFPKERGTLDPAVAGK